MSKFGQAFGDISSLRVKTFDLGGHSFKVRIPLTGELEAMTKRIESIDKDQAEQRFAKLSESAKESDGTIKKGNDLIVDGRSIREMVNTILQAENRIVEYMKLLVPADGQSLDSITYADIEAEFPFPIQIELLNAISEAIQPSYKEARKN